MSMPHPKGPINMKIARTVQVRDAVGDDRHEEKGTSGCIKHVFLTPFAADRHR